MSRLNACRTACSWLIGLALVPPPAADAAWPSDPVVNVPLCTASSSQLYPGIIGDGASGAIAVWVDNRNSATTGADIYARRVQPDGTVLWTADGRALCTAAWSQLSPAAVPDGGTPNEAGTGAIVFWRDARVSGLDDDIYAQRISASGTVRWTTDGVPVCTADGTQFDPAAVPDGAGGAIATWVDYRGGGMRVYAQRISPAGAVLWTADGVCVCNAANVLSVPLAIVPDGAGGAIIIWEELRGAAHDIYAQRVSADGTPLWAACGVPVCTAASSQMKPVAVPDGAGGAVIAWYDWRGGPSDIYAQRISGDGVAQWTTNGVSLCAAGGNQQGPKLVSDGSGGAIVTWTDERMGAAVSDIYAQRVSGGGVVQWAMGGVPVCTATGAQVNPNVASDGADGVIATWGDYRSGASDIYAQRLSGAGTASWAANGIPVSNAAGDQKLQTLVPGPCGGAIVTWQDARSGSEDIYAQRILADGQLGGDLADVPGGEPLALALDPVRPNPSRGGALAVRFALAGTAPASLALLDVAGRRVAAREVGSLGAGWHTADLGAGRDLAPGLYLVCLRQGPDTRVTRVAVLR